MDVTGIVTAVQDQLLTTGLFESVNLHEPKSAPSNGVTAAVWADRVEPLPRASGLNSTTGYVVLMVRLYTPMLQQPYDGIDPRMVSAVDTLMTKYSGAFTLTGKVRNVDLLGEFGTALSARAGYLDQDRKMYRVMDITLPLVVNDLWSQVK